MDKQFKVIVLPSLSNSETPTGNKTPQIVSAYFENSSNLQKKIRNSHISLNNYGLDFHASKIKNSSSAKRDNLPLQLKNLKNIKKANIKPLGENIEWKNKLLKVKLQPLSEYRQSTKEFLLKLLKKGGSPTEESKNSQKVAKLSKTMEEEESDKSSSPKSKSQKKDMRVKSNGKIWSSRKEIRKGNVSALLGLGEDNYLRSSNHVLNNQELKFNSSSRILKSKKKLI